MRPRTHVRASGVAVAACAVALAGCEVNLSTEGLSSRETKTFTVSGEADLTLETFDGPIEIHSWERNEVEVEIERRAMEQELIDQMEIQTEQDGDRIVLRVKGPARSERRGINVGVYYSPSARLRVAMPRKGSVQARTEDGSVRAENLDGRIVLRSGDGSINADRVSGELEVRTDDGAIRMNDVSGRLQLDTDDGSITIEGRPSVLRARTGDGAIRVRLQDGTEMADAWDLSTRDGSVTLALPATFGAEVDAETSDGSVRSSHPDLRIEQSGEGRRAPREVRTRMGSGGPTLKVRTGDGSIRFER